jgi:hypothetical protein
MGGSAKGERRGGRQRGVKNRRTAALAQAQAEAAEKIAQALGPAAHDGDALSFLQLIYRDGAQPMDMRLHAAKAAVGYERPRLVAAAVALDDGPGNYRNLERLSDDELRAAIAIQEKLSAPPTNPDESFLAIVNALDDAAKAKGMKDFEEVARKVLAEI